MKLRVQKFIVCKDYLGKKQYKIRRSRLKFRPAVYGVIIRDDKVLFTRQWDGYDFPGGGMEKGETIEQTLKREIWEETGLKIAPGPLISCGTSFFKSTFTPNTYFHSILLHYVCLKPHGKLNISNLENYEKKYMGKPEWVPIEKVKSLKFYNQVDNWQIVQKALKLSPGR